MKTREFFPRLKGQLVFSSNVLWPCKNGGRRCVNIYSNFSKESGNLYFYEKFSDFKCWLSFKKKILYVPNKTHLWVLIVQWVGYLGALG